MPEVLLNTPSPRAVAFCSGVALAALWVLVATTVQASPDPLLHWRPLGEPGRGAPVSDIVVDPHDPLHVIVSGRFSGIRCTRDGGATWLPGTGFKSWETGQITFHPTRAGEVWVGTLSGPYKSDDGGRTWSSQRSGFVPTREFSYSAPIEKILFDPANALRMLAIGGSRSPLKLAGRPLWGTVWQSLDAGQHWSALSRVVDPRGQGLNLVDGAFTPGQSLHLTVVTAEGDLYESSDGGNNWSRRVLPPGADGSVSAIQMSPVDPGRMWLCTHGEGKADPPGGGVFTTADSGKNWTRETIDAGVQGPDCNFVVAPSNPKIMLSAFAPDAAAGGPSGPVIYWSDNAGVTWQRGSVGETASAPASSSAPVLTISPSSPDVCYAAGPSCLLVSHDAGRTWLDVNESHPPGSLNWRGTGSSFADCSACVFDREDPEHVLIGLRGGAGLWESRDGMQSWFLNTGLFGYGDIDAMSAPGSGRLYVCLNGPTGFIGIAHSRDAGKTWATAAGEPSGLPGPGQGQRAAAVHALPDDPDSAWAAVGGKLYRTADGGVRWRLVQLGPGLRCIQEMPGDPGHFFVGGDDGIYETTDGGSFQLLVGSPRRVSALAIEPANPPRVYAAAWLNSAGGLWRMETGRWTRIRDDPWISSIAIDPVNADRLVVSTDDEPYHDISSATGVWISADAGVTWSAQNAGLPTLRGSLIEFNPQDPEQLVFGSRSGGFWAAKWPSH